MQERGREEMGPRGKLTPQQKSKGKRVWVGVHKAGLAPWGRGA